LVSVASHVLTKAYSTIPYLDKSDLGRKCLHRIHYDQAKFNSFRSVTIGPQPRRRRKQKPHLGEHPVGRWRTRWHDPIKSMGGRGTHCRVSNFWIWGREGRGHTSVFFDEKTTVKKISGHHPIKFSDKL
jgi:hypothetical protein